MHGMALAAEQNQYYDQFLHIYNIVVNMFLPPSTTNLLKFLRITSKLAIGDKVITVSERRKQRKHV